MPLKSQRNLKEKEPVGGKGERWSPLSTPGGGTSWEKGWCFRGNEEWEELRWEGGCDGRSYCLVLQLVLSVRVKGLSFQVLGKMGGI